MNLWISIRSVKVFPCLFCYSCDIPIPSPCMVSLPTFGWFLWYMHMGKYTIIHTWMLWEYIPPFFGSKRCQHFSPTNFSPAQPSRLIDSGFVSAHYNGTQPFLHLLGREFVLPPFRGIFHDRSNGATKHQDTCSKWTTKRPASSKWPFQYSQFKSLLGPCGMGHL